MEAILKRLLEAKATYLHASHVRNAKQDELIAKKVPVSVILKEPEFEVLNDEAERLFKEFQALTPHMIRANLKECGLQDMEVTGVLMARDHELMAPGQKTKLGQVQMLLSDLCGLNFMGLVNKLEVEYGDTTLEIVVEKEGKVIGRISSDGYFNYDAAPDLRTALGWKVATDGGRESLIQFFDLSKAAQSVLEAVRTAGTSKEAFFGLYMEVLQCVIVYKLTSRFSDGYYGSARTLWQVATRELGQEHPGYNFAY